MGIGHVLLWDLVSEHILCNEAELHHDYFNVGEEH
jgi:hypothetical protein